MSYLDNLVAPEAADSAVITAIQTQLTSQQALINAQQAAVTALQAALASGAAAQSTVDALQQAAIDAQVALNAAQAAALTAEQVANSAQQLDIAVLQTIDLHVAEYTPGDVAGTAPLTQANFQDAIEACIVAAYALAASMTHANSELNGSVRVRIPPGIWFLSRGLVFPGPGQGKASTPALVGSGMHQTILVTSSEMTGVYTAAIRAGGSVDADSSYCMRWECGGFSLIGAGGSQRNMNGIHITLAYKPYLHDMQISGFQDAGQSPLYGFGVVIDDPYVDTPANTLGGVRNNQHVQLYNVWSERNFGGFKFRGCSPCVMTNCHGNQNYFCDVVLDTAVMFYWVGGTMQGGGDSSASVHWFGLHKGQTRVVSGWNKVQASGTGADCTVATGDECTVNLPGAALSEDNDVYKWLELRHPTQPYNQAYGVDRGSGVYLITKVISPTQCKIRKGSSHGAFSGYTWQVRTSEGSFVQLAGRIYHEGSCYAAVGMYALEANATAVSVKVTGVVAMDYSGAGLVESYALGASIVVEDNLPTTNTVVQVRARRALTVRALDADLTGLDLDEYSREGVICRTSGNEFANRQASRFGGLYSATDLGSGRLRTLCKEAGANAMLDARVKSSIALTGSNVTGWTDLVGGTVGTLENAGQYPVLVSSDPYFAGQPSILFGAGASAALAKSMLLTLPAGRWDPRDGHRPCMLVVARAAHASQLPNGTQCHVGMFDDASSYFDVVFNHYFLAGIGGGISSQLGLLLTGTPVVPTTDANYLGAHALMIGSAGRPGMQMDSELGFQHFAYNPERGWVGGRPVTLRLNPPNGGATADLWIAFVATFPHGISVKQRERLLDACCNEFGIPGR